MKKEERKKLRFNKVLPVENLYEKLLDESNDDDKFIGLIKELLNKFENDDNLIEEEKIEEKEEMIINKNDDKKNQEDNSKLNEEKEEDDKKEDKENINIDIDEYDEKNRNYFKRLFPSKRNEKPGSDYYITYTISMTFIIVFILLFYTTMVQDKTFGSIELTTKQFSGEMVIFLLIHISVLVYDRILYISQNTHNLKPKYILYNKNNRIPLSDETIEKIFLEKYPNKKAQINSFILPPEFIKELNKKYDIIYIQNEGANLPSIQKYILQIILVIFIHIFTFFYCPMIGNWNIYNNVFCPDSFSNNENNEELNDNQYDENLCNDFTNNIALIGFYIFYVIYFTCSGLQIKYGFYDIKRKSLLKSGNNPINSTIYKSIKSIPFLYEIKLAIDWTFTKTCLDFFQWNKFESIYDIIYCTYCEMNGKNQQLIGQKIGKILKISIGGTFSFVLIVILIIPLMLFSSLNPTNQLNNLTGARLKIDLGFFYKSKAIKNYTLFENTKPMSIENIENSDDWNIYNYSESIKTKNFPKEQIQSVKFYEESDKNWDLTWPHIDNLRKLIMNRKNNSELEYIGLILDYSFDRPLPPESMEVSKRYTKTIYYYNNHTKEEDEKLDLLGEALYNCKEVEIEYNDVYSPPIRASAVAYTKRITDEKYFPNLGIKIGFVGCKNETNNITNINSDNINETQINFFESYFTAKKVLKNQNDNDDEGIKFHVFSDKVSTTTSGKNILTLYVSFVLVVGTYIRNFFASRPETTMLTELSHPEEIINLCEAIKVARYRFDYVQEEKLYYYLMEIMRSPDYLRILTQSSIEQFKQRKKLSSIKKISDNNY